jgi:hypothetical protein
MCPDGSGWKSTGWISSPSSSQPGNPLGAVLHRLEGLAYLAILSRRETYLRLIRAFLEAG